MPAKNIILPYEEHGYYHVYHLYVVETRQPRHRDALLQYLNNANRREVPLPDRDPPAGRLPRGHPARIVGAIPNSERNAACCISLPMFPELTEERWTTPLRRYWRGTMSAKYRVVVVRMGKRGMHYAQAFQANGRFEVVGVCDIDPVRLDAAATKFGAEKGTDALEVASPLKPDVFCFCTLPSLRAAMASAGIKSGARLIAFEKPVALNTKEGFALRKLIRESGVKAVVSHQHR